MMEDNDVNKNIPPKVEKLEQVFMLIKVIEPLMWKEVMMLRWFPLNLIIGRLEMIRLP